MEIKSYGDLIDAAKKQRGNKTVAVAMANEESVLKAVLNSVENNLVNAILVGDEEKINDIAFKNNLILENVEIINEKDEKNAAKKCVELILNKKAHFLMKGFIKTSTLLKAVLKEKSLRQRDVISHVAILDIPNRDDLFFFTDGGIVEKPDKEQKKAITENLIDVAFSLGKKNLSIGFLSTYKTIIEEENKEVSSYIEKKYKNVKIYPSLESKDAFLNHNGLIANVIEECNIITKSLTLFTDTVFGGIITGTKVPICLVSRSDTEKNKAASLALGAIFSNREEK